MKKTNKKGFTLVELLAVIVILAVLILIALPNVMNIMSKARKDAFKDEASAIWSAAENAYVSENISTGCTITYSQLNTNKYIKGNKTNYKANIVFNANGEITSFSISNGESLSITNATSKNMTVDTTYTAVNEATSNTCSLS